MATSDLILSIVASEQGFLASILSAEVIKAERSAHWISLISDVSVVSESWNDILTKALCVEKAVSCVINATARKEAAIAAKVTAIQSGSANLCPISFGGCSGDDDKY